MLLLSLCLRGCKLVVCLKLCCSSICKANNRLQECFHNTCMNMLKHEMSKTLYRLMYIDLCIYVHNGCNGIVLFLLRACLHRTIHCFSLQHDSCSSIHNITVKTAALRNPPRLLDTSCGSWTGTPAVAAGQFWMAQAWLPTPTHQEMMRHAQLLL